MTPNQQVTQEATFLMGVIDSEYQGELLLHMGQSGVSQYHWKKTNF
jgi:dUTPase